MTEDQRTRMSSFPDTNTSPSRQHSPQRAFRTHARASSDEFDLLLEDLSPTKTLNVFLAGSDGDFSTRRGTRGSLTNSGIHTASTADKTFGVRVAQTAKQLRAWCWELEGWDWPGTFEIPSTVQRAAKRRRVGATEAITNRTATETESRTLGTDKSIGLEPVHGMDDVQGDLYWGSLPAGQAQDFEKRVDDIQEQMDDMDVEELKNHVLDVHNPSRSRPASLSGLEHAALSYSDQFRHLDDYTALITATVMQALPYLSRLTRLLHVWSVRLAVSRRSTSFLSGLDDAQSALQVARSLIDLDTKPSSPNIMLPRDSFDRPVFDTIRDDLGERVTMIGQLLDKMLDDLEGREDTIPSQWIEEFEALEMGYTNWVVEAGKYVLGIDYRLPRAPEDERAQANVSVALDKTNHSDQTKLRPNELDGTEEQTRDTKHDTLTEPLRISVEKANTQAADDVEKPTRDYILGAALSSHPPSDPSSATHNIPDALQHPSHAAKIVSKQISTPSDPRMLGSAVDDASFDLHFQGHDGQEKQDQPEPKTLVPDTVMRTTSLDNNGRNGLSAKINALMGREDKLPTMHSTNTPVRPFERASSGFGRLFNKQKEGSESAESSASESPQRTRNSSTVPKSKDLSLRSKQDAGVPGSESFPLHALNESEASLVHEGYVKQDAVESAYSTSNAADSPNSSLRKDLSDIHRAADSLAAEQQPPSREREEGFVARPRIEPEESYFEQGNWAPQSPIPRENGLDETFEPHVPVATDDFYSMFVDSLPQTPAEERGARVRKATENAQRPGLNERSLTTTAAKSVEPVEQLVQPGLPLLLTKGHTIQRPEVPESDEFKPIRSPLGDATQAYSAMTGASRTRNGPSNVNVEKPMPRPIVKRASIAAIESFPRSELKSVQIRRADSQRSIGSHSVPQTPVSPIASSGSKDSPNRSSSTRSASLQESRPSMPRNLSNPSQPHGTTEEEPPPVRHISHLVKTPPLSSSANTAKRPTSDNSNPPGRVRRLSDTLPNSAYLLHQPPVKNGTKQTTYNRPLSEDDRLERQISSILSTIPTRIRLTSNHAGENPEPKNRVRTKRLVSTPGPLTPAKTRNAAGTRSPTPTTPSTDSPSQPTLTLAPAKGLPPSRLISATPSYGDTTAPPNTGVRLYHLIQPGSVDPIKLFVRLVGEDSTRVMVRVGGGWADLGDYLQEFAHHHGRRTVSGEGPSRMEMVGIDRRRTASGNIMTMQETGSGEKARGVSRPTSAMEVRRERAGSSASSNGVGSAGRPGSSGGTSVSSLKARPMQAASRHFANTMEVPSPGTPTPGPVLANAVEPDEMVRIRERTPSSTASARIRLSEDDEQDRVSLSGPFARREMSAEKQKWVHDMLGQARKVSSEHVERVGGTKRVLFRGLSNSNPGANKKEDGTGELPR